MSVDSLALLTQVTLDGIHAETMDVPRGGYGVIFVTHALQQIHRDPPVVDVLSNTGKLPLQSD
jgi:hypothetical protein